MSDSIVIMEQRYRVDDEAEFGRVAVMLGGDSSEREGPAARDHSVLIE